ncbi:amidohydrolase family protein [Streptomyces sp. NPDC026589]|uniref:metal-dependent hydrolase family protein n=1 Tax=Streptomyces sp. NPDC026589 TaxID=3155609 RepID=UPI0033CF68B9
MTPPPGAARLYTAALLLTEPGAEPVRNGAVLVRDGVVAAAGPAARLRAEAGAGVPVREFPGGTLLPGLIDTHVHLVFDAGPDPVAALRAADDRTLLLAMAGRARRLLDAGVTTARDLGDRGQLGAVLRDAVERGTVPGPRLLTSGSPVTVSGGHCWYLGGQADSEGEIRRVVRENFAAGAAWVKIMASGGTFTPTGPPPHSSQFSRAELAAAVSEARRFGRRVAVHAHGTQAIEDAVAVGVDTLEHCSFATLEGPATDPESERLLPALAEAGVAVCPTLSGALYDTAADHGEEVIDRVLDLVARTHRHGVPLIAGTDAGMPGSRFDRFGEGVEWFAHAGLSTVEALRTATVNAADALGLTHRTGRLLPGLDADLLVVDGDPRADLRVLRRPRLVVAQGRPHVPAGRETA